MSAPHSKRPALAGVVHVTQKLRRGLPRMRRRSTFRVLAAAVRAGNERPGFRVTTFSVLSNHLHFLVEARDNESLARGMQGLAIRVAKALNRHWGRRGQVFRERYFAAALRRMKSMRRALVYVLQNARRHGVRLPRGTPDPFSSGPWFRFWRGRRARPPSGSPVVDSRHPTFLACLTAMGGVGLDELPAKGQPTYP